MQETAGYPGSRKWVVAVVLACAAAINYADRAVLSSVLPLLRSDLHLSDVELGSLGSVFLWSYALASPLAGILADRVSRSRLVWLSVFLWSLVTLCTGLCSSFGQLIGARVLLGLAESLYLPAATALLADYHGVETRARAMSLHSIGLSLGVVMGGTSAGILGDHFGWRPGFWVLGSAGIVLALVARRLIRDGTQPRARIATPAAGGISGNLVTLAGIPSFHVMLVKAMLSGAGIWIFFNWLPLFYRESFHLSLSEAGFAGTFLLQAAAMSGIAAGRVISDRLASRRTGYRMLFHGIAYLGAAPMLLPFFGTPGLTAVNFSIFGFSLMRALGQANECPVVCDVVEPRLRSTALGFMNTAACMAGGLGVLLAGILKKDFGLAGVFAGISGLFLIGGSLLVTAYFSFLPRDLARQAKLRAIRENGGESEP